MLMKNLKENRKSDEKRRGRSIPVLFCHCEGNGSPADNFLNVSLLQYYVVNDHDDSVMKSACDFLPLSTLDNSDVIGLRRDLEHFMLQRP